MLSDCIWLKFRASTWEAVWDKKTYLDHFQVYRQLGDSLMQVAGASLKSTGVLSGVNVLLLAVTFQLQIGKPKVACEGIQGGEYQVFCMVALSFLWWFLLVSRFLRKRRDASERGNSRPLEI